MVKLSVIYEGVDWDGDAREYIAPALATLPEAIEYLKGNWAVPPPCEIPPHLGGWGWLNPKYITEEDEVAGLIWGWESGVHVMIVLPRRP